MTMPGSAAAMAHAQALPAVRPRLVICPCRVPAPPRQRAPHGGGAFFRPSVSRRGRPSTARRFGGRPCGRRMLRSIGGAAGGRAAPACYARGLCADALGGRPGVALRPHACLDATAVRPTPAPCRALFAGREGADGPCGVGPLPPAHCRAPARPAPAAPGPCHCATHHSTRACPTRGAACAQRRGGRRCSAWGLERVA